ncbi:MAG: hypothetical protein J1F43_05835 [Muribaculaceae bacterium]|nr:hypothetical protein [Muribaculaceae bacterium]
MKKFYMFVLAVSIALGANAAKIEKSLENARNFSIENKSTHKGMQLKAVKKASAFGEFTQESQTRAGAPVNLEGEWTFYYGDYYFEEYADEADEFMYIVDLTCEYVKDKDGNEFWDFTDPTNEILPFILTYDETVGYYALYAMWLGSTSSGQWVTQEPFLWNYDTEEPDYVEAVYADYDTTENVLFFEEDAAIMWGLYKSQDTNAFTGVIYAFDLLGGFPAGTIDDTGIEGIISEDSAPVFFNLQGQRIENPNNGLFIRKQGKTATKVMIR